MQIENCTHNSSKLSQNSNNKISNYYYYQVLSNLKQVLKMLTTKNYKVTPSPTSTSPVISHTPDNYNLNYEAAGQLSDQKSHRFFRFGLKIHLSVENLNCCDTNKTSPQIQNQTQAQIQNHSYNQNQNQLNLQNQDQYQPHPLQNYYSQQNGNLPALSFSSKPVNGTVTGTGTRSACTSPPSSLPSSWQDSYLLKSGQPPYFYSSRSPPQSIASSMRSRSSSSTTDGSGENGLREWDSSNSGMEKRWGSRLTQLGAHLSNIRVRIPDKVVGLIDNGRDYARSHPVTFVTLIALLLSCSVPVVAFLFFAMSTVAVTFIGFLFVEGTLLTVASVALTTTLLLVGFTTLTLTSLFMLFYLAVNSTLKLVTGSPLTEGNPIHAFMQFLSPSSSVSPSSSKPSSSSSGDEDLDQDLDLDLDDDLDHEVVIDELSANEGEDGDSGDTETVVVSHEDDDDIEDEDDIDVNAYRTSISHT